MDGIRELLETLRKLAPTGVQFRGLLHIAIGRKVTGSDGVLISSGMTWREVAIWLKDLKFDRHLVAEFAPLLESTNPRDRERFWYAAIARAGVDSAEAVAAAEELIAQLEPLGYRVSPPPSRPTTPPSTPSEPSPPGPKGKKPTKRKGK